ncbi:hypothetical protein SAMN05216275_11811 [Streptosporangium canum]|uniref:Meckel syndrome type 1 protein n=1 Tax=Streptosporangium canum TaxID=324952 RepID=A0A1I3X0K8_9ACTN|nr:hypothetical protein [Streptosporangium canum]SFK13268.1 hypothetical protein SAMN05216275_11811 [Streptosporangium canum]
MAVPDIVRNVTRNVREALSSREGFKEKAKDLPLYVLQSALSGVGQALLLGDRMRTTIKRIAGQDADTEETHPKTADELAKDEKAEEKVAEKPARREPVIFAPRPESASPKEDRSEANGAKPRPEPVIFTPAKPKAATGPAPAAPEAKPTGSEPAKTAETEVAETKPAEATETEVAETKPAETTKPETRPTETKLPETKPAAAETAEAKAAETTKPETKPAAEATETKPAEATKPTGSEPAKAARTTKAAKAAEAEAAETGIPAPAAVGIEVTEVKTAKPQAADAALVEVTETKVATPVAEPVEAVTVPAEPMPGYGQLTVASLRARMRGKTAEQIREFLAYERATTVRAEVVRMYENRLAKLEAAE